MERINVTHSTGEYTIYAGEGILGDALSDFFAENKYDRICVVSDSNVWSLHVETLTAALSRCERRRRERVPGWRDLQVHFDGCEDV